MNIYLNFLIDLVSDLILWCSAPQLALLHSATNIPPRCGDSVLQAIKKYFKTMDRIRNAKYL